MNATFLEHTLAIQREHKTAIGLLKALNEGDDSVLPQVHTFLKSVAAREAAEVQARSSKAVKQEKRRTSGRKNSGNFEIAPREEGGVDYGNTGLVLARKGDIRLVWRTGHKFWADMMQGFVYTPGDLVVMNAKGRADAHLTDNHRSPGTKDTRLTRKLIERHADKIDALFGAGAAARIAALTATVLLDAETAAKVPA